MKTEREIQDELAAQELQGGGPKSRPSPVHPSMRDDTEYDPDADATDAAPDDDDGDFDEDRRP